MAGPALGEPIKFKTVRDLPRFFGWNTHWNFAGWYQNTAGTKANPDVVNIMLSVPATGWRQRGSAGNPVEFDAVDKLYPQYNDNVITVGNMASKQSEFQAVISKYASVCRDKGATFVSFALPNEPNGNGGSSWPSNIQKMAGWARSAIDAEEWPGDQVPLLIGPGLKRAGFAGDDDTQYDADIAALAAIHLETLGVVAGDFHWYPGNAGPGARVSGLDSNGNMPPGVVLGSDGKCSATHMELQRARQVYHDPAYPMFHTEFGWTSNDTLDSDAARFGPEATVRHYLLGMVKWFRYELLDEWPYEAGHPDQHEGEIGTYVLDPTGTPDSPVGPKPEFTAMQDLLGADGIGEFSDIGWLEDISGVFPDCGVIATSYSDGSYKLHFCTEVQTTVRLVLDADWKVKGQTRVDDHYDLDLSGDTYHEFKVVFAGSGITGDCDLGGEGTLTIVGTPHITGTAAFFAVGRGVDGTGPNFSGEADTSGLGVFTGLGHPTFADSALSFGVGEFVANGTGLMSGAFSGSGVGTLTLAGGVSATGTCDLTASGSFHGSTSGSNFSGGFAGTFIFEEAAPPTGGLTFAGGFPAQSIVFSGSFSGSATEGQSYVFTPPTIRSAMPRRGFWSYFSTLQGQSVLKDDSTGLFVLHPYPSMDDLFGKVEGLDYFLGGHSYEVGQDLANELTESGFQVGGFESFAETWAGDAQQNEVYVSTLTQGLTSVGVAIWPQSDAYGGSSTIKYPPKAPSFDGWTKTLCDGLEPNTRYYRQIYDGLTGDLAGRPGKFVTLAPMGPAGKTLRKFAAWSCQTDDADLAVPNDLLDFGPDWTVDMGDRGYTNTETSDPSSHIEWRTQMQLVNVQKTVTDMGCNSYVISDHDGNGTGVSNLANFNDPVTKASIASWETMVPARMEDTREPKRDRGRFAEREGYVAYFKPDTRCLDKTWPADPHNPKSAQDPSNDMLGAGENGQLGRMQAAIEAAAAQGMAVAVIYTDPAWPGLITDDPVPNSKSDKWPAYQVQRDALSALAAHNGLPLYIIHGDSHGMGHDHGTHEPNGHAVVCASPLQQHMHMAFQDHYDFVYPQGMKGDGGDEGDGTQRFAMHYQRFTVDQVSEPGVITITSEARDCTPSWVKVNKDDPPVPPVTPVTVGSMVCKYIVAAETDLDLDMGDALTDEFIVNLDSAAYGGNIYDLDAGGA